MDVLACQGVASGFIEELDNPVFDVLKRRPVAVVYFDRLADISESLLCYLVERRKNQELEMVVVEDSVLCSEVPRLRIVFLPLNREVCTEASLDQVPELLGHQSEVYVFLDLVAADKVVPVRVNPRSNIFERLEEGSILDLARVPIG